MLDKIPHKKELQKKVLQGRAQLYQQVRAFFSERHVLEVETPIFSQAGNPDPSIQSLIADFNCFAAAKPIQRYAHTSPEFSMKRLLAEGAGDIYQICKVFRPGELGRLHNPEFTMLEWYRPQLNYYELMDEIEALLTFLDIASVCHRIRYEELFKRFLNVDVMSASVADLQRCAKNNDINVVGLGNHYDDWCDLLLTHLIEPELAKLGAVFVYDYPASQAALANICVGNPSIAERFELYIKGVEMANGYQELTNADEYRTRFVAQNNRRLSLGLNQIPIDENLLTALAGGLPDCAGVALGMDRLLMCFLKLDYISDTLSIDFNLA